MSFRMVGFGGLAFVVATATLLSTVIVRSPHTHDHISVSLSPSYGGRTSLDSVVAVDLPAVLADMPAFSFPETVPVVAVQPLPQADGQAHIAGDEHGPTEHETVAQEAQSVSTGEAGGTEPPVVPEEPLVQQITFTQFNYGFDPARIELKVGVPVELVVTNEGDQVHGIWIPEFAISEDIRSGKSKTFTFTPEETGRIRYTCSYNMCGTDEEHAQMKGFITVK